MLTALFSCEKDDGDPRTALLPVAQVSSKITTVSSDKIPEIMEYLNSVTPSSGRFTIQSEHQGTRSVEPDLELGEMELDEIQIVINSVNDKNYTFLLKSLHNRTETTVSVFNLILRETETANFPYILEYRMERSYFNSRRSKSNVENYDGKVIYYDIDGHYSASLDISDGDLISYNFRSPCPGEDSDSGGNGGNDTGDSGPGDSGTGDSGPGDGTSSGGGELIIPCPCAGHMPWNDCGCAQQPIWVIGDKSPLSGGLLNYSFISQTRGCGGSTTDNCASENDCEFGWDDDCNCLPNPNDSDEVGVTINLSLIMTLNTFFDENIEGQYAEWLTLNEEFSNSLIDLLFALEGTENEEYYEEYLYNAIIDLAEDDILDEEFSYPKPHCSSFEYASGLGGSIKGAAVSDIHNFFLAILVTSDGPGLHYIDANLPTMYFTVPSSFLNGVAATESAIALDDAIDVTEDWFLTNPEANPFTLIDVWKNTINSEMNTFGGMASPVPPFDIPNPAPYVISLFTTGNCN